MIIAIIVQFLCFRNYKDTTIFANHQNYRRLYFVELTLTNTVQPPIPVLYKIAEILQVHPTDLLVDEPINGKVSLKDSKK